jgi:hypothetical protein
MSYSIIKVKHFLNANLLQSEKDKKEQQNQGLSSMPQRYCGIAVAVPFETVRFWVAEKVPFVMVAETLVTEVCF